MHTLIRDFICRIIRCFTGYNLLYHIAGAILTYIAVKSGFDWFYHSVTRSELLQAFMFPAVTIGSLGTMIILITLFLIGTISKNKKILNTAIALIQAVLISIIIITIYKALTGRAHPSNIFGGSLGADTSHIFQFGLIKDSIFYGWPSGHTAAAFAFAVTIWKLHPNNKIKYLSLLYAFYIGIGVSTNIHWFSDFLAGALVGTTIGRTIGKNFLSKNHNGI